MLISINTKRGIKLTLKQKEMDKTIEETREKEALRRELEKERETETKHTHTRIYIYRRPKNGQPIDSVSLPKVKPFIAFKLQ